MHVPIGDDQRVSLDELLESRSRLRAEVREVQANPPPDPSDATRARLREHGIAVFERRCIFDAQPPITTPQLASVEAHCGMKIPDDLVELWTVCFGGELFYDLHGNYEGVDVPVSLSFSELFYNQSPFYRDLDGWITHEIELAREVALEKDKAPPATADYLPFGGFEYLDRAYVRISPDDFGSVWYWKKALPPGWNRPLKQDSVTRVAASVKEFFSHLHIDAARLLSMGRFGPRLSALNH